MFLDQIVKFLLEKFTIDLCMRLYQRIFDYVFHIDLRLNY